MPKYKMPYKEKPVTVSKLEEKTYGGVIKSWATLRKTISELTECELEICIAIEANDKKRKFMLERMYSRFNQIRRKRELGEILKDAS